MATPSDTRELIEKLQAERAELPAVVKGIDEARAELRPPEGDGEDGWSVKEQLSHLAQMEGTYRAWVERALV